MAGKISAKKFQAVPRTTESPEGKFPDLDFYVDRWPDPQAAAAVANPVKEFYRDRVIGLFSVADEATTIVLKDNRVVNWSNEVHFNGVSQQSSCVISALAKEFGATLHTNPCVLLKATKQDVQYIPVPDGVRLAALTEEDISEVAATRKGNNEHVRTFIRDQIAHFPSVVLKSDSGEHMGQMMGKTSGVMDTLFVLPQFRGKGLGKVIVSQLAHMYFHMVEDAYVFVGQHNQVSLRLHRSLGFKPVPNPEIFFITCFPAFH